MTNTGVDGVGDSLAGKAVLVTGASSGIGAAVAVGLGRAGAMVALHYNKNDAVHEVAALARGSGAPEAVVLHGDFSQPGPPGEVVRQAADAFGGLDVLVNNAGDLLERRALDDLDEQYVDEVLQLNFSSMVQACRAGLPFLRRSRGAIVNVTSLAASLGGGGNSSVYAAAKGAANTFTRALAKDLAPDGVRANAVSPGVIETAFHDRHSTADQLAARARQVPLGRLGVPEDCVGAALFLASNAASGYITGQILEVNGGSYMR